MPIKRQKSKSTGIRGIREIGPGRFLVSVVQREDKTGKEVRKKEVHEGTLKGAIEAQERLRTQDVKPKASREKWRDYATRWATEHLPSVEPSTKERYLYSLGHIAVTFGDFYVDAIEAKDIRQWTVAQRTKYEATTINSWLRCMRVALDEAVETGVLASNPARSTRTLREGRTKGRRATTLSPDQFRAFLAALDQIGDSDITRMIRTLAWTGCRIGEIRALKWDDWRDGELYIERSVWKRHEKTTKTDDPRIVVVVDPLAELLAAQRRWLLESQHPGLESGLVFPATPNGALAGARRRKVDELSWFKSGSSLTPTLRKACALSSVPELSPHALRRTFDAMLRKANVDSMVRRGLAGWRTEDAQAIYTHVDRDDRATAGRAFLRLVEGEKSKRTPETDTRPQNEKSPAGGATPTGPIH